MDVAAPSSRSPQAIRGTPLRVALRELGNGQETPAAESVVVARSVPVPAPIEPPPAEEDEEPPPPALRPQQLARWLNRG